MIEPRSPECRRDPEADLLESIARERNAESLADLYDVYSAAAFGCASASWEIACWPKTRCRTRS